MSRGSSKRPAMVAFALAGLCALVLVILTGCAAQPQPLRDEATFSVRILDDRPDHWAPSTAATTYGSSRIEMLRDYYPECLTHEIRHVFEGAWHDQRTTCR